MFRVQQKHKLNMGEEEERYSCTTFVLHAMQVSFHFNAKMSHQVQNHSLQMYIHTHTHMSLDQIDLPPKDIFNSEVPHKILLLLVLFNFYLICNL
jgi:hypothetical protein